MATRNPATFPALDSGAFATTDTAQTLTNKTLTNPVLTTESISLTTNNLPAIRPTLNLDFANSQSVDPRITFTRASTASRVNSKGLIELVPSGVPRIDFDPVTLACKGLLIEETRTNLLTYSENFDNAVWTKTRCSITPNVIIAPDGTLTADKLVEDTTASASHPLQCEVTVAANTSVTLSVFVKAGERGFVVLRLSPDGTNLIACGFDLTTGIAGTVVLGGNGTGASATITAYRDWWYKCSLAGIPSTTVANPIAVFYPSTSASYSGTGFIYTGDGTSGLYIWGAELNAAAFPASYIPSTETHTGRASTATYYNSLGQIAVAASGVARLNYNPANLTVAPKLLLEAAGTNLLTYSEDFSNAAWVLFNATITANSTAAPDGLTTADTLTVTSSGGSVYEVVTVTAGTTYTFSFYAKAGTLTTTSLAIYDITNTSFIAQNVPYTPGTGLFNRVAITFTTPVGCVAIRCYTQRDTIAAATGTVIIWGADLKADAYLTSYIPTTSAAVTRAADTSTSAATTRAADVAVMTGANFSSWYRQDEGSIATDFTPQGITTPGYDRAFDINDGTAANAIILLKENGNGKYYSALFSGNTLYASEETPVIASGASAKVSIAYKANDFAQVTNGLAVISDTSAAIPKVTKLGFCSYINVVSGATHVKSFKYYPLRLPNATLQALSAN